MNTSSAPIHFSGHLKNILKQAWPVLVGSWASIMFGVLDTAMAGHAGPGDLQAMALAASIYITVFVGLMGVVHALIPIIAQLFGAGKYLEIGAAWGQGIWMTLGLSVVGCALLLYPGIWLAFSGEIEPSVRDAITWYLRALAVALPATLLFRTIYSLGTAVSRPKPVMLINMASVVFKLLFNWIFIFGNLGMPALGAVGAGVSTALVGWMTLAAGLIVIRRDPLYARFKLRLGKPERSGQIELLRLGIPMGGSYLIEVCAFTFMSLLVAREGMFVSGGHQIMANLAALCYMMPMATGIATASLVAQAVGANDIARARSTGTAGITLVLIGACLTAFILLTARNPILRAYTNDAEVFLLAAALLQILPFFHIFDSLQCIGSYILRAYKVAVIPLLLQILALTGVGLLGGWWVSFGPGTGLIDPVIDWIAPGAPKGAAGMWLMAMSGLGFSAALLLGWYRHILKQYARRP